MKRTIVIELVEEHSCANFYTIRFADEEISEFDKFYDAHDTEEYGKDLDKIGYWMDKIGREGEVDRNSRPEGGRLKALPLDGSRLRLYFFNAAAGINILGNGGVKNTDTYEEDPHLNYCVETLRRLGSKLMISLTRGTTCYFQCNLFEKLEFTIDIPE